jgi:ABC-type uncharacterized transport system involved in gliding motility auxiliary subunit
VRKAARLAAVGPAACRSGRATSQARAYASSGAASTASTSHRILAGITAEQDIASVAGQLAELTQTVQELAAGLKALSERANRQQELVEVQAERGEIQQERIELAARELAEVSARLQSAANALRESV